MGRSIAERRDCPQRRRAPGRRGGARSGSPRPAPSAGWPGRRSCGRDPDARCQPPLPLCRGRSRGPRASGGARPDRRSSGCHEGRRVRPRASPRSWPGRTPGIGESAFDLPEGREHRAEPSCRRRVEFQQTAPRAATRAARTGARRRTDRARSRPPAPPAIRTRPPITLGEGARRIDRRISEQADRRPGRGQARRALIREADISDGDVTIGTTTGRRTHVVEVLGRGVRELEVAASASPHLEIERVPTRVVVVQDQPQPPVERVLDHHEVLDDNVHPRRLPRRQDVEVSPVDGERRRTERALQPSRKLPAVATPRLVRSWRPPGRIRPRAGPHPAATAPGRTPGPRRTSPGIPFVRSRPGRCRPGAASRCVWQPASAPGSRASGPRRPWRSARTRGPRCAARRTSGGPDPGGFLCRLRPEP